MTAIPAEAVARVLEVLDRMEIPYLAGGSVASSIHGISRPTLHLDIVADFGPAQAEAHLKVGDLLDQLLAE